MNYQWTARNEDKPHRCPGCHGIAMRAWDYRGYAPRTIMRCPTVCGLRWRVGTRGKREPLRYASTGTRFKIRTRR